MNKGATKCFPILLRYFYFEKGEQNLLLDFYKDSDETSEAIASQLLAKLDAAGLDLKKNVCLHSRQCEGELWETQERLSET